MSDDGLDEAVRRIAEAGHRDVVARLRDALEREAGAAGVSLAADDLDREAATAVALADAVLWRRALAGAAGAELGISLNEAVYHPAVLRAHAEVGAPPFAGDAELEAAPPASADAESEAAVVPPASPDADALRVAAVHLSGIEALRAGERDLELRISSAGLDVLKRSSGAPIGRLQWEEIETVELPRGRRGLRRGRRAYELQVATRRGRASFELPGVTEEQLKNHLEPMLVRARAGQGRPTG